MKQIAWLRMTGRYGGMGVIFLGVFVPVAVATVLAPRWYRSEVPLLAKPMHQGAAAGVPMAPGVEPPFVVTQRQIIRSDSVLASSLMRLEGQPPALPAGEGDSRRSWYDQEAVEAYVAANAAKIETVRRHVAVTVPAGQAADALHAFAIRVEWPEDRGAAAPPAQRRARAAERARDMAGFLADAYLMHHHYLAVQRSIPAVREQAARTAALRSAEAAFDQAAEALRRYSDEQVKGDLPWVRAIAAGRQTAADGGAAPLSIDRLQIDVDRIDEGLTRLGALLACLQKEITRKDVGEMAVPDAVKKSDPGIGLLQQRIVELKIQINSLLSEEALDQAAMSGVQEETGRVGNDLRAELDKQCRRLKHETSVLKAQRKTLEAAAASARSRLNVLAAKATKYMSLQRRVESAAGALGTERKRLVRAEAATKAPAKSVLVLKSDQPTRPAVDRPLRPVVWRNLLLGIAGGLVPALGYALLFGWLTRSAGGRQTARQLDDILETRVEPVVQQAAPLEAVAPTPPDTPEPAETRRPAQPAAETGGEKDKEIRVDQSRQAALESLMLEYPPRRGREPML